MKLTNNGKFMHCLPIRRNVVATDEVIDRSLVFEQTRNREYAAQAVLQNLLEELS
jgi:N-succinyl-L-ornithine transcarbamylase